MGYPNGLFLAGSRYQQSGVFEVKKCDIDKDGDMKSPPQSPGSGVAPVRSQSALDVTVPSELDGISYIQVLIQKGEPLSEQKKISHVCNFKWIEEGCLQAGSGNWQLIWGFPAGQALTLKFGG